MLEKIYAAAEYLMRSDWLDSVVTKKDTYKRHLKIEKSALKWR